MMDRIRVAFMGDESPSALALQTALTHTPEGMLVDQISHPMHLITSVSTAQADLVVVGLQHVSMTLLWHLMQLHQRYTAVQSLICLASPRVEALWGLLAAGVTGYLHEDDASHSLSVALISVRRGGIWWSPGLVPLVQGWSQTQPGPHTLLPSPYEIAIVTRVAKGQTNRQIAQALGVRERTIYFHLGQLYRRWGVHNRTQAALFAQARGWIDTDSDEFAPTPDA